MRVRERDRSVHLRERLNDHWRFGVLSPQGWLRWPGPWLGIDPHAHSPAILSPRPTRCINDPSAARRWQPQYRLHIALQICRKPA